MAVSFWLRAGRVPDVLQTWIEEKAITPWSPTNHRVQSLWHPSKPTDFLVRQTSNRM